MANNELRRRRAELRRAPTTKTELAQKWTLFGGMAIAAVAVQTILPAFANSLAFLWLGVIVGIFIKPRTFLRWWAPSMIILAVASLPFLSDGLLTLIVIGGFTALVSLNKTKKKQRLAGPVEQDKIIYPAEMTKRDIAFFRSELDKATVSVNHIEELMNRNKKTKAINTEYRTGVFSYAILAALRRNPMLLTDVDEFLNSHLPSLERLLMTYENVASRQVHTDDDYSKASDARAAMIALSEQIEKDYHAIVAEDYQDLDEQIEMAKFATKRGDN